MAKVQKELCLEDIRRRLVQDDQAAKTARGPSQVLVEELPHKQLSQSHEVLGPANQSAGLVELHLEGKVQANLSVKLALREMLPVEASQ